jgi:hypothetical protein
MLGGMATLKQKIDAECKMRELLEDNGLPPPDAVEYGSTCIRLFFNATKVVVVVDIDEVGGPEVADEQLIGEQLIGEQLIGEQLVDEDEAA